MRLTAAAALAALVCSSTPVLADAPPKHLLTTPLTQADVDFYLSIKRPGADCVLHATGPDKAALDIMRKNHGVLKIPAMPEIKGNPTPAQLAQLQADMGKISAQATANGQIEARVAALALCDETIAQKRGVKARYDDVRAAIEAAVPMQGAVGSCGGGGCGPDNATLAQLALWKKEAAVFVANQNLLRPHADEIRKLQKTMISAMGL
ncbi:MAG TPA: hypothetical protein VII56_10190 [Rhizomicrobium sp.]